MQLKELVKNIHFKGIPDNREISAITYDSRKVKPGTLFVAITGENSDGHEFISWQFKMAAAPFYQMGGVQRLPSYPFCR